MLDPIKNLISSVKNGTYSTSSTSIVFDSKAMLKAIEAMPPAPPDIPLFFFSNLIDDDDIFMNPRHIGFYSMTNFDNNTKTVYVCGKNAADALIKKGITFENYKPEDEK